MKYTIEDFEKVIETLFSENGCPWDKSQTFHSLKQSLLEETYELIDAVEKDSNNDIIEEIGDLFLVAMLYTFVGQHNDKFKKEDVYKKISEKMIFRHPHVFGNTDYSDWNWDKLKQEEKKYKSNKEILELIPKCSPALLRSDIINKKTEKLFETKISKEESQNYIKNNIDSMEDETLANCLFHMSNIITKNNKNSEIILNKFLNDKIENL